MKMKAAIIGAGPIGLEAALAARERGWNVTVYERGRVGDAMRRWGHTRMFSPFDMNASPAGMALLKSAGLVLPEHGALLSGREFVEIYLQPLAVSLGNAIHAQTEVTAITRSHLLKGDFIGDEARGSTPFRLLVRSAGPLPAEHAETADLVLDCSGTYSHPRPIGDGGMPAPGESECHEFIYYGLPDITGESRSLFSGARVLVVGSGHSAATAVRQLAQLNANSNTSRIYWLVRGGKSEPCRRVENDPLAERDILCREANELARGRRVELIQGFGVDSISLKTDGMTVSIAQESGLTQRKVDRVIAACGFRPDISLARELQTQMCWATEGTYKLAASLLGESGGDCLGVSSFGPETLLHPERNYFALGMKSYGRTPDFLIRTGYEQVAVLMKHLDQLS